jgi:hypothetical protein
MLVKMPLVGTTIARYLFLRFGGPAEQDSALLRAGAWLEDRVERITAFRVESLTAATFGKGGLLTRFLVGCIPIQ